MRRRYLYALGSTLISFILGFNIVLPLLTGKNALDYLQEAIQQKSESLENTEASNISVPSFSSDGYISSLNDSYNEAETSGTGDITNNTNLVIGQRNLTTWQNQTSENSQVNLYSGSIVRSGQRIDNFPQSTITEVDFYLRRVGSPTGTASVTVRSATNDSLLGTIGTIDVSTLTTTLTWKTFTTTPVKIDTTQNIRIQIEYNGGSSSNYIRTRYQSTNVTVFGYRTSYTSPTYTDSSGQDQAFIIKYYTVNVSRGYLFFDTSGIPDNAIINNVTLRLYGSNDSSNTDFFVTLQSGMPDYPHNPLITTDFNQSYYSGDGGSLGTIGLLTTGYNNLYLNNTGLSWINKTGITKFCLRSSRDIEGNGPSGNEYVSFYASEQGEGYRPNLSVSYMIVTGVIDIWNGSIYNVSLEQPSSVSIVTIDNKTVNIGDTFWINLTCYPAQPIKSFEFGLSFDQNVLQANSVVEGNFFNGYNVFFNNGTINNTIGKIINIYNLIIGQGNVSTNGTLVSISFIAIQNGTSPISFLYDYPGQVNPGMTNETAYVPATFFDGNTFIGSSGNNYGTFIYPEGYNPNEYYNDSGTWKPINLTIKPYNDGTYNYIVNETWYTYCMRNHSSWGDGFKFSSLGYDFIYQPSDYSFRNQNGSQDYIASISDKITVIDNSNYTATYTDVFPNVTLQYEMQPGMVKEYYIIDKLPREPAEWLGINVTVDFGGYIKYGNAHLYVDGIDKTGTDFYTSSRIEFRDINNTTLYYLPEPYATDAVGNSTSCYYEVKTQGQQIWFYVRTPYSFFQNATYPVKVDPPLYGLITPAIVSSYEWDPEEGRNYGLNGACRINNTDYYLLVCAGQSIGDYDGWARVIYVWPNNGTIRQTVISSFEYDESDGWYASVRHIPGTDKYVVAYNDAAKVTVVTLQVWANNGTIKQSVIDSQIFTYKDTTDVPISLLQITNNVWVVAYTEATTYDGFLETFWVNSSGTINDTLLGIMEFDTVFGFYPYLCMIDGDTVAISYNSIDSYGDFNLVTWNITSAGIIGATASSSWAYAANPFRYSCINKIGPNIFSITYIDSVSDIYTKTVTIADTGAITAAWIDTLMIVAETNSYRPETFVVHDPQTSADGSGILGLTYKDAAEDGWMYTWNVTNAGVMSATCIGAGYEFDTTDNLGYAHVEYVNQSWYLIVYTSTGIHGWSATVTILTNWASPTFSNPSPINGSYENPLTPFCNVTIEDNNADTMIVCFWENTTGSWVLLQSNDSVANGSYGFVDTTATGYYTTYYWMVTANDSIHNVSTIYGFVTINETVANTAPIQSGEVPINNTQGINNLPPRLYVLCTDNEADTMNATWMSNSSGSWAQFASNLSIANNTNISQVNSNFTTSSTRYWWSVNLSDGTDWTNRTYNFRTFNRTWQNKSSWNGTVYNLTIGIQWKSITSWNGTVYNYTKSWKNTSSWNGTIFNISNWNNFTWWNGTIYNVTMPPTVTTNEATGIGTSNATLQGTLTYSGGEDCTVGFEYGLNTSYGTTVIPPYTGTGLSTYIYAGGYTTQQVYQYWASNMTLKANTSDYGGIIWALAEDSTYIYAGGLSTNKVYQYYKSNLTKKAETLSLDNNIFALTQDDIYIFGGVLQKVYQYWKSNMTKKAETADYGDAIKALVQDDTYIYAAGHAITSKVYQYWKSNMTKKAETLSLGGDIFALTIDDTYVYAGGSLGTVRQYWKSNMTKKADALYGTLNQINALTQDSTYIYAGGVTEQKVYQYWKSNMTKKAETASYGGHINALAQDSIYIYAGGYTTQKVYQYWKSNMTKKAETADYGGIIRALSLLPTYTTGDTFSFNTTGLASGTTYHFRAYANNSAGGAVGEDKTFTTAKAWQAITWNGTIYNTSSWNNISNWNGTIYNQSMWNNISAWNGTIYNISHWKNIETWNGTIYNTTNFSSVQQWNGTIWNQSRWLNISAWNGTIFNISNWNNILNWNGTIWNASYWINTSWWNGTVWNESDPDVSTPTVDNETVGYGFNVTINVSVWDNGTGVDIVLCNVVYPDGSNYTFTMNNDYAQYYTAEINLTDTWQWGQHNYTIIAYDNAQFTNTTPQFSFNVSSQFNITFRTEQDTYIKDEYVNITNMETFGMKNTWDTGGNSVGTENQIDGSNFTCPKLCTAKNIMASLYISGCYFKITCAIYNASDKSLIATTGEVETNTSGWYSFNFTTPPTLYPGTAYYLVAFSNSSTAGTCTLKTVPTTTLNRVYNVTETYPNYPDPWTYTIPIASPSTHSIYCSFSPIPTEPAKLNNTGPTNSSGYLLMQTEFYDAGTWQVTNITLNETTLRRINISDFLNLSILFNGSVYTTTNLSNGSGTYRVYIAFRDPYGNVLKNNDGNYSNASYVFVYTEREWKNISWWNGTIYNQTIWNNVSYWNGTIYNISNWVNISNWNGTIYNQSVWNNISYWNGTIWNQSNWKNISYWNGTIYNKSAWVNISNWNGTIYNTTFWSNVSWWNGSIYNVSHWNNISNWNGTIYNQSIWDTVGTWNGTIYNVSNWINTSWWNGTIWNLSYWVWIRTWNGTIFNVSRWNNFTWWNGSIYNYTIFQKIQEWNGTIWNQSRWLVTATWNGTIYNSTVFSSVKKWNGTIWNKTLWAIINAWNGTIYNISRWLNISWLNGTIFNQTMWSNISAWNGTIFNQTVWINILNWNGSIYNISRWVTTTTWNGTIYNETKFSLVEKWNGTIWNKTLWVLISIWNGTIYNTSVWKAVSAWNGTIYNISAWKPIGNWNGTIYNQSIWNNISNWNGTIYNISNWHNISSWNGTIYNISNWSVSSQWNGTIWNMTKEWNTIGEWNGAIYNGTGEAGKKGGQPILIQHRINFLPYLLLIILPVYYLIRRRRTRR